MDNLTTSQGTRSAASVVIVDKELGETPLECLEHYRTAHSHIGDAPMTYAGRLDPLATGLLVVLIGEECKNKDAYLAYDKEYEFEMLIGVSSDTGDLLGMPTVPSESKHCSQESLTEVMKSLLGRQTFAYPAYSSKPVEGKPLFVWAREGRLDDIEIPTKEVDITKLDVLAERDITAAQLREVAFERIAKVKGDFRQHEIVEAWQKTLTGHGGSFQVIKCNIECSSGTYVRAVVEEIGKRIGQPTLAYSIRRTRVGPYRTIS